MLGASNDLTFRNSYIDIRFGPETLNAAGARYELECYDTSHINNHHYFVGGGLPKPLFSFRPHSGSLVGLNLIPMRQCT